jgi:uncharacterized protein YaiE (UPF0345 family)
MQSKSIFSLLLTLCGVIMLSGCSSKIEDYTDTTPVFSVQDYFTGPIKAWGIVQDRSGKIVQRVDIDMVGTWTGDTGTLAETLKYYDGRVEKRTWQLKKVGENKFTGTAEGIVGTGTAESNGMAIRWQYVMTIPVDGKNIDIKFDDWMYAMNDNILVNRSYMSKFGFKVAEISLFMQKP